MIVNFEEFGKFMLVRKCLSILCFLSVEEKVGVVWLVEFLKEMDVWKVVVVVWDLVVVIEVIEEVWCVVVVEVEVEGSVVGGDFLVDLLLVLIFFVVLCLLEYLFICVC